MIQCKLATNRLLPDRTMIFQGRGKYAIRRDGGMETDMVKTKIKTAIHQVNPYEAYKGADTLVMDNKNSMHCDVVIERQITVPIPDAEEYLRKLKGDT